jgi:Fe-S oxidoreductase
MFKPDLCNLCGDCLVNCQWMNVERSQAIAWQKEMLEGRHTPALDQCITCFACNERCPKKANPFDLHGELQEKFRSKVPEDTVKTVEARYTFTGELGNIPRAKRIMTSCSFEKAEAALLQGELYSLPRVGGKAFFCWGLFAHMGAISVQKKHTQLLVDRLAQTGAEEVVCFHAECYSVLASIAPDFGIHVPFRPIHLAEYLVEYLRANRSRIKFLDMAIAYQRPCSSRLTPDKEDVIDELFDLTGVRRVERKYDRDQALCCSSVKLMYNMGDTRPDRERNMADAKNAGAQAMVYFCPVCRGMLADVSAEHGIPLVFLSDLARMALGEIEPPASNSRV